MTTEQRRALAAMVPTTEVIKDAVTFPRERLGEPLDISPERFDAWFAGVRRAAKAEALREAARDMGEWADESLVVTGDENDESTWREWTAGGWLNARADRIEAGDQR